MRECMLETWLRDEESTRNTLSLPQQRTTPVTDILQWLQCFVGMVGVLSQKYPQMVPELMVYQAMIVKCSHDFEGLAWVQYDWAYRRQAAQTKDLGWSCLNLTLFSLCFAGKARRNIACAHCLSDNYASDMCPENPSRSFFWWQHPSATPAGTAPPVGVAPLVGGPHPVRLCNCHLFNTRDGPKYTYSPCKFACLLSLQRKSFAIRLSESTENTGRHKWKGENAYQQAALIVGVVLDSNTDKKGNKMCCDIH